MRNHTVTRAVTLGAVASLAAVMGAASAAPATVPSAAHTVQRESGRPVVVDCFWHPEVRPGAFMIACGDGNSLLSSVRWSSWGPDSAVAQAVNMVNDCTPYCAAGRFHAYPVVVRLDHPQPWKKHPQLHHYTRMSLTYIAGRPDGFGRVVTYPLWD